MDDLRQLWRVAAREKPDLAGIDPGDRPGAPQKRSHLEDRSEALVEKLSELQARLWAERKRSLLLVLQALDAGGKDGTVRKVFTGVNPQGVSVTSFKAPTTEELEHDFLWRIHHHTPRAGEIAVFNRSQYEDVLVARVENLVPEPVWRSRYEAIRGFEQSLSDAGTSVVKVFLHISRDEQAKRFRARLEDPTKRWKFSTGDLAVRERWDDYQVAYTDALGETSTETAPWYVVPADDKKYRNWAVLEILVATLEELDLRFPDPEPGLDSVEIV